MSDVVVIIVNYKTGRLVAQSLERLSQIRQAGLSLRVVVVDNQSPDDSCAVISQALHALAAHDWAHLEAHAVNAGFAAGNNVGFAATRRLQWPVDHFLLLNPDAILEPDALAHLLKFDSQRSAPAVLGCQQINEAGHARPSAFRFPGLISEFQRGASLGFVERHWPQSKVAMAVSHSPHPADWVTGAAFLLPKAIVDQVGDMDDGYFLYYEEVDYLRKIRLAGFEVWSVPAARVCHLAGAATGIVTGKSLGRRMPAYWYQSWRRYFLSSQGYLGMYLCGLAWLSGHAIDRLLSVLVAKRRVSGGHHALDFIRYALLNQRPRT